MLAVLATLVIASVGMTVNAATTTKPYTATWVTGGSAVANPPNQLGISPGSQTLTLRITNNSNPQSLGSANVTVPSAYVLTGAGVSQGSATVAGAMVELRNLNLAPGASLDATIAITAPCLGGGAAVTWPITVKQANTFSGPPGNDFVLASGTSGPSTAVIGDSQCLLRFRSQPNTTHTGSMIRDGFGSAGNAISIEIYDPGTGAVVASNAAVTLVTSYGPSSGTLSGGGPVNAVGGVATFPDLSLDRAGPYKLRASSPAASNQPDSNQFMVSDTIDTCTGAGCTFSLTPDSNSYSITPKKGAIGATFVASVNLSGLTISCAGAPYNYPDSRQPNAIWYAYNDGTVGSVKTNVIVIDKAIVQLTSENGASFYRVCYTSPEGFKDRNGNQAPLDQSPSGPSAYFGTAWYTGLLPDCAKKNPAPPCVLSWTGDTGGNRIGTFLTPAGDPGYR